MTTPTPPDPLAVTIEAIAAQPGVMALVNGPYPDIPHTPTWPLLVASVVTGLEGPWGPSCVEARVQIDVWGAGNTPADLDRVWVIARALTAAVRDLRGSWPSGAISNSAWLTTTTAPDPDTGRHRLVVDLHIDADPN